MCRFEGSLVQSLVDHSDIVNLPRPVLHDTSSTGCGFIGSHTVERLLRNGENVSVVDTMNAFLYGSAIKEENLQHILSVAEETGSLLKVYKVDITDKPSLEGIFANDRIEIVCHLAARAGVRPSIQVCRAGATRRYVRAFLATIVQRSP